MAEACREKGYEICAWTCGTDRYNDYKNMAEKYGEKAGLTDDFQVLEVKRSDEDISATKVRQALLNDDKRTFDQMTPFGTLSQHLKGDKSVYEVLKKQINIVMNK
jgi:citrate lyase synthetase